MGLFDDTLDRLESQAAFCIVTVTYAHKLRTILAKQLLGALLAGGQCAPGSHRSLSRAEGGATGG